MTRKSAAEDTRAKWQRNCRQISANKKKAFGDSANLSQVAAEITTNEPDFKFIELLAVVTNKPPKPHRQSSSVKKLL